MTASKARALPISVSEFKHALLAICQPISASKYGKGHHRFAIAVSGGVDSMALAYLCSKLMHETADSGDKFSFRALVVDHEARNGSAEEAQKVAAVLRSIALQTDILKLNWNLPTGQTPSNLGNFESAARRLRYQALAKACLLQDQGLLTAHHEDDQAETVLVRILAGYTGRGLQGMVGRAEIPECHNLFDPSMAPATTSDDTLHTRDNVSYVKAQPEDVLFVQPPSSTSPNLHRPLLGFTKARLIETCQTAGIPWFEDPTNQDVTLTMRNTIRNLWKQSRLPNALSRDSMLRMARNIRKRTRSSTEDGIAQSEQLTKVVDLHSGILRFVLNSSVQHPSSEDAALAMLGRLALWVSPQQHISKRQLVTACKNVFRASPYDAGKKSNNTSSANRFTTSNALWQRKQLRHDPECWVWTLSRQPFSRTNEHCCLWQQDITSAGAKPYDTWQLFDGRFWIKVRHQTRASLSVQPLQAEALMTFRAQLDAIDRDDLDRKLTRHAPGKIRFTLPVLVDETKREVLALPTIGFVAPVEEHLLQWNVKYKDILR